MDALLNRIRGVAREEDAAIAEHAAGLAPLSQETRGRIARLILEQQTRDRSKAAAVDELAARRRPASRRTFFMATGGMVAAAAALMLWMRPGAEGPALPVYVVAASGGVMDVRGAAPAGASASIALGGGDGPVAMVQRVRAQTELLVTCRPDTAVAGPVAVRAFLVQGPEGSPQVSEVRPRTQIAATGAVELRIAGAELGHARGQATLRVAVGRPDTLRALDGRAAVAATGDNGVRWLAVPLDLETAEP